MYKYTLKGKVYSFADLKTLLARATPIRSGDQLASIAATSLSEMVAAQYALTNLPLKTFLNEFVIPPEQDEVTRLILQQHDAEQFSAIAHFTVGELRNFFLSYECTTPVLTQLQYALTPEMVAAVSKIMRNQDLIAVASKCEVITQFRNTIGLKGRFSTRLQANDPCDDLSGITSGLIEGLTYGCGDAVIGINPATDDLAKISKLLQWLDYVRQQLNAPIQTCVLTHISNSILLAKRGIPIDLFFQSIGGTEAVNKSFGINLTLLQEAHDIALSLHRGSIGTNCMYFETGQGSALSANAHHGVDQQTLEARSYAVARQFSPLLVNTVVGFIGPEYLFDGKQIIRAGLEDHFCGKLLGLPMGCDVCYTNHSYADQNDMDNLLSLLALAGCNFTMAVPGADDIMLNYQSTSFQDSQFIRNLLKLRPSPEFEQWLEQKHIIHTNILNSHHTLPFHQTLLEAKTFSAESSTLFPSNKTLHTLTNTTNDKEKINLTALLNTYNNNKDDRCFDFSQLSHARLGQGHTGGHVKDTHWLSFQSDFAEAKDVLLKDTDLIKIKQTCTNLGLNFIDIFSQITKIESYLLRPDLGKLLSIESEAKLADYVTQHPKEINKDLLLIIGGGLSPTAVEKQIPGFLPLFLASAQKHNWSIAPIILTPRGRVALGDQVNQFFHAKITIVLIGERPGLTIPDSMGIYFTYQAKPGCTDEQRNCISNIHQRGLSPQAAVVKLNHLLKRALAEKLTGVNLKDD